MPDMSRRHIRPVDEFLASTARCERADMPPRFSLALTRFILTIAEDNSAVSCASTHPSSHPDRVIPSWPCQQPRNRARQACACIDSLYGSNRNTQTPRGLARHRKSVSPVGGEGGHTANWRS